MSIGDMAFNPGKVEHRWVGKAHSCIACTEVCLRSKAFHFPRHHVLTLESAYPQPVEPLVRLEKTFFC